VVVATPDLDAAYRIFSVLNSRGLDLTATDILKAEIIGEIPQQQREIYTRKWEDTEEDLGRDSFGDLFGHIRMVYRKSKPQGTLLKEFNTHVREHHAPRDVIDKILIPMAQVFEQLTDAAYTSTEGAEQVNTSLRWLNRLVFNDWVPPALAFSVRRRNESAAMVAFFRDLERLTYSLLLNGAGINERIERFSRLTQAIEENPDSLGADDSPLQLSLKEQARTFEILSGAIYEGLAARARTTIVLRLDSLLSGGGAQYDYDTITVEHVLPQNPPPTSQWISWFPDPNRRSQLVHQLGNLALLTRKKNSSASNYEFDRKKEAYFTLNGVSPFPLTTQVLQHTEWTPEIIAARQTQLLTVLTDHWRLDHDDNGSVTGTIALQSGEERAVTARALNIKWSVGAKHCLYSKDGTWYHRLEHFPGALFDASGYLLFESEEDLATCPGVQLGPHPNQIHVYAGIASIAGYVRRAD
jgi:hypothetical protein